MIGNKESSKIISKVVLDIVVKKKKTWPALQEFEN